VSVELNQDQDFSRDAALITLAHARDQTVGPDDRLRSDKLIGARAQNCPETSRYHPQPSGWLCDPLQEFSPGREGERKQIDRSCMEFLGAQKREMLLSDLAKAQANQEAAFDRADLNIENPTSGKAAPRAFEIL
jgi:hypothetical protein